MIRLSSHEAQRHWGRVQDMALIEPVAVTSKGRDRIVMLSFDEYQRLKSLDFKAMLPHDFSDEDLMHLSQTKAPKEAKAFDHEVLG